LKQTCSINLLSDGSSDTISHSDTIPITNSEYTEVIFKAMLKSNSDHSYCSTVLLASGFWQGLCEAVGEHLSSWYVSQVNLSISSHICSKILLGHNVCNCTSARDCVLNACDQWLWIGEPISNSRNAKLVDKMDDFCEFHAAYSEAILSSIGCGLGSQLLLPQSAVNRSSDGDDYSTGRFIVIWASSVVQMNITSKDAFCFMSECTFSKCSSKCSSNRQWPVLNAIEVPKRALESFHMLIARGKIVLAENYNGICVIRLSGGHRVHWAANHRLVYGWIAGFLVGLPLVKLYFHWRGNWCALIHSELPKNCPNIPVLMDVVRVLPPIAFDVHAVKEGDIPQIMYPKPLHHPTLHLPKQALISNDKDNINLQNDNGNNYVLLGIIEPKQSSVDPWSL